MRHRIENQIPVGYVVIPPGSFWMGSPASDREAWGDEGPQHPVHLTEPFLMKQTEVTQEEWEWLMGNNPSYFHGEPFLPVEMVSWYDAVAYCNVLSEVEGIEPAYSFFGVKGIPGEERFSIEEVEWDEESEGYRLPTEAEWEYTCRAGTTAPRYGLLNQIAWFSENSNNRTHTVGQKSSNYFGLYDMIGNVWEWCWDWYGEYSRREQTNPKGPIAGTCRVFRGGSWGDNARYCRAARRYRGDSGNRYDYVGFRPCRSLPLDFLPFHRWREQTEAGLFYNPGSYRRGRKRRNF